MNFAKCIEFFNTYDVFFAIGMFVLLVLFAVVNLIADRYRRQNRRFNAAVSDMLAHPNASFAGAEKLPEEYRRQWRAFLGGSAEKPSDVFEFVPLKRRLVSIIPFVCSALCAVLFVVAFVPDTLRTSYLLVSLLYVSVAVHVFVLIRHANIAKTLRAKRLFAKFVALLNRRADLPERKTPIDENVREINRIAKKSPDESALVRVADILRSMGLSEKRTVEQQRKINNAVNGLLQSFTARTAKV